METKEFFRLSGLVTGVGGLLGFIIGIAEMVFNAGLNSIANELDIMTTSTLLAVIASILQLVISLIECAWGVYSIIMFDHDEKTKKFFIVGIIITVICLCSTVFTTIADSFNTLSFITGFLFSGVYLCFAYKYNKETADYNKD